MEKFLAGNNSLGLIILDLYFDAINRVATRLIFPISTFLFLTCYCISAGAKPSLKSRSSKNSRRA